MAARAPPSPLLFSPKPLRAQEKGRGGGGASERAHLRCALGPSRRAVEGGRLGGTLRASSSVLRESPGVCVPGGLPGCRGACAEFVSPRRTSPPHPRRSFPRRGSGKDRRPLTRNAHRGCGAAALRRCEAGGRVVAPFPQRGSVLRVPPSVCGAVYVTSALPAGGASRGAALSGRCLQCCVRAVKPCLSVEEPGLK